MKNILSILILFTFLGTTMMISSCGKDETTNEDENTPVTPTENQLCDGKQGNNCYWPLATGNKWVYEYNYTASYYGLPTYEVVGTQTIGTYSYFIVAFNSHQTSGSSTQNYYLRIQPSNNDVYIKSSETANETLYFPGNPAVGDSLGADPFLPYTQRLVESINATYSNDHCTYTDCVRVRLIAQNGSFISFHYYKKGLGKLNNGDVHLKQVVLN